MQNSNWFKVGIYSKQMTTIMVLLGILCIGQLSSCVDGVFTPASAATVAPHIQTHEEDENGISFVGPDGKTIMMPKHMRDNEEVEGFLDNDTLRLYIAEGLRSAKVVDKEDYSIHLNEGNDFIEIWRKERLIGTLSYRTSLGRMIIKDNE